MEPNRNGNYSTSSDKAGTWPQYDRLPKRIKRILQNAHNNYSTRSISRKLKEIGVDATEKLMVERLALVIKRDAKLTYGPDHPQAQ